MPHQQPLSDQLERIAARVHSLAFDAADDRRGHAATEKLHDDIESVAEDLRATVRGSRQ